MSIQQKISSGGRWAVVLAGGEGERMKPLIRQWLGSERPKQYCAFDGGKTMLEFTLERARAVAMRGRILIVIGPRHLCYIPARIDAGRILEQPAGLETGPGIFLPAAHALRADPDALLLIFPSDHYIHPLGRFRDQIERAAAVVGRHPDKVVLMGAAPDGPKEDYGWIEPDWTAAGDREAMPVARFCEKPPAAEAAALFERGCLWNTFIMAVRARTLWDIGRRCLPRMMDVFDRLLPCLGDIGEVAALEAAYRRLSPTNFSKEVLEKVPESVLVQPLTGVEWSDWGRPSRIRDTLRRRGLSVPFAEPAAPTVAIPVAA